MGRPAQPVLGALVLALGLGIAAGDATARQNGMTGQARWVRFADVPGWVSDDHAAAFEAFRRSCTAILASTPVPGATSPAVPAPPALRRVCAEAAKADASMSTADARRFFERWFRPERLNPALPGLMTGYFEPEVPGSRVKRDDYTAPLFGRPDDLVSFLPGDPIPPHLQGFAAARRLDDGVLEPYPDRGAIEDGALDGRGLELIYVRDRLERFIVQVQGSARVRLDDGTVLRVAYAARNGHPYSSIGRELINRGVLTVHDANLKRIRDVFTADPALADDVMRVNRSFVFFRLLDDHDPSLGPIGAQGVPLTPYRSIAVDRTLHAYGTPFYVVGHRATGGPERPPRGLMIAQDTGTAIVGPRRIDVFTGWGDAAGAEAGILKNPLDLYVLRARDEAAP